MKKTVLFRKYVKYLVILGLCCSLICTSSTGFALKNSDDRTEFFVIYVNSDSGNDNNIGTSPALAKKTVKNATDTVDDEGIIKLSGTFTGPENCGLKITRNVQFEAYEDEIATFDGQNTNQIFDIEEVSVSLTNLILKNGKADNGGAIYNNGRVEATNCVFTNNKADNGGAIFSAVETQITCEGCTFTGNKADCGDIIDDISESGLPLDIHFSRLICDNTTLNNGIRSDNRESAENIDLTNNWWGTNNDPSKYVGKNINIPTWLIFSITPYSNRLYSNETSNIIADVYKDNTGEDHQDDSSHWFEGSVIFTTTHGNINPKQTNLRWGNATTTFKSNSNFTNSTITATLDNQNINTTITLSPPKIYVNPEGDDNSNGLTEDTPKRTIQNAIDNIPTGGEIYIENGYYDTPGDYKLTINRNMSLIGLDGGNVIDPDEQGYILLIKDGAQVNLQQLTLKKGINLEGFDGAGIIITDSKNNIHTRCNIKNCELNFNSGAAICNEAQCNIINTTFTANTATTNGGAIHNTGICNITTSTFEDNIADNSGGAIYNSGACNIIKSIFVYNYAPNGGTIHTTTNNHPNNLCSSSCSIDNTTITGSIADYKGGAIYNEGIICNLTNTKIIQSEAGLGGAICNIASNTSSTPIIFNMDNTTIETNSADNGSAIYNEGYSNIYSSICNIKNSDILENGAGNGTILNNQYGLLYINNNNFTENNAHNGAAIINTHHCEINNTNFTRNDAQLDNSTAGAILNTNTGSINIDHSNFDDNCAENGGAIYTEGNCNINNSLLTENFILNGAGGAIYNSLNSNCTINHTQLTENRATTEDDEIFINLLKIKTIPNGTGGGIYNNGALIIQDSTINNNDALDGGGIYNNNILSLHNTKITENTAKHEGGGIFSKNSGLEYDDTCEINNNKPDNILSHLIYVTTNGDDKNDGLTPSTAKKTIQNAINTAPQGYTVQVAQGTYTENLKINKNITLKGNNQQNTIINGNQNTCIDIYNSNTTIKGFTITNGKAELGGGIHHQIGSLTIQNTTLTQNTAEDGGAIHTTESNTLTIQDTTITQNNATRYVGGGINSQADNTIIQNSIITKNNARFGGGINSEGKNTIVQNSIIAENNVIAYGGGICTFGRLTVQNSTITKNNATFYGGGIYAGNILTLQNSTITENHAGRLGGGIFIQGIPFINEHNIIKNNTPHNIY